MTFLNQFFLEIVSSCMSVFCKKITLTLVNTYLIDSDIKSTKPRNTNSHPNTLNKTFSKDGDLFLASAVISSLFQNFSVRLPSLDDLCSDSVSVRSESSRSCLAPCKNVGMVYLQVKVTFD